jgi:hypothetical protein
MLCRNRMALSTSRVVIHCSTYPSCTVRRRDSSPRTRSLTWTRLPLRPRAASESDRTAHSAVVAAVSETDAREHAEPMSQSIAGLPTLRFIVIMPRVVEDVTGGRS